MHEHQDIIDQIKNHLDIFSTLQSKYEFNNFFIEAVPTPARSLILLMEKIENLHVEISTLTEFNVNGKNVREITAKIKQLNMLLEWYNNVENPEEILMNFEKEEPKYWAYVLGRDAAIEILSRGVTSKETLNKMSLLPLQDFEEAVRICTKFANMIKNITESVEGEFANVTSGVVTS